MHCFDGAKLKNICRTVQVLPECLRLSKKPAVHCSITKTEVSLKSRIKTTLPTSGPAEKPLIEKETHDPCAQALLLTGAPDCPAESATGSHQCHSLQQPGPWLRPATTYSPYRIGGKYWRDQATEQPSRNKNTNELRDHPIPDKRGEREEIKVAVCVHCWGRQSSAILTSVLSGLSH